MSLESSCCYCITKTIYCNTKSRAKIKGSLPCTVDVEGSQLSFASDPHLLSVGDYLYRAVDVGAIYPCARLLQSLHSFGSRVVEPVIAATRYRVELPSKPHRECLLMDCLVLVDCKNNGRIALLTIEAMALKRVLFAIKQPAFGHNNCGT